MIDTHTHLNLSALFDDHEKYFFNARDAGVTRMMTVGVNIETSKAAIELAKLHPEIWAAVGIHPEEAGKTTDYRSQLTELIEGEKKYISAIGECGLDYSGDVDQQAQKELFVMQAKLAVEHDLPLLIHCRNTRRNDEVVPYSAYEDLLILLQGLAKCPRFVLHCASGPVAYVEAALKMGAYVSFAGNVTYPNAGSIRELLKITPLDRLLVETDAPFLSPQSKRGTQNEPANVIDTATFIAEFLGISFEEIDTITTSNALTLFSR